MRVISGLARMIALFTGKQAHVSYAPPPRIGPRTEDGHGATIAARDLAEKRERNKRIPDDVIVTRQQGRAEDRKWQKRFRVTPAEQARRNMAR